MRLRLCLHRPSYNMLGSTNDDNSRERCLGMPSPAKYKSRTHQGHRNVDGNCTPKSDLLQRLCSAMCLRMRRTSAAHVRRNPHGEINPTTNAST